jgi:transposase
MSTSVALAPAAAVVAVDVGKTTAALLVTAARDGTISREGSVELRRALIDLGIGLWLSDPAAKRYGQALRARGKKGGVITCAMAHRANKIAYALVRDQTGYQPARWA